VCYGIALSNYNLFVILEKYNPDTCIFFTPIGEIGFALHEIFEVSGLNMGYLPYEEYIPNTEELNLLKRDAPQVYETYWEVVCHFHIYAQVTGWRSGGVKQVSRANYVLYGLGEKLSLVSGLATSIDTEITERISESVTSYTSESNEDTFKPDTIFDSFHHQARIPISNRALLAGFLMLWLKRYVVPTPPHEVNVSDIVYLALLLAYGRPLSLLPAMVGYLQSRL